MPDFSDPQYRQKFYQTAKKHGKSDEDILEYMSEQSQVKSALELGFDESGKISAGDDMSDKAGLFEAVQAGYISPSDAIRKDPSVASYLTAAGFEEPTENAEEGNQVIQLVSQLKDLYYGEEGSRDDLAKGRIGGLFTKAARSLGASPRAKTYKDLREGAASVFKDLVGQSGQLTDKELERLEGFLPKVSDNKKEAEMKWQQIDKLLSAKYGDQSDVSFETEDVFAQTEPEEPPQMNVAGGMAGAGDLIRGEDGSLKIHGDFDEFKEENFKIDKNGNYLADNNVIRFLVDSRFLPIAGALAAAPLTGGASLVPTLAIGAATAAGGTALQRGLMELTDPDRAELGDHAKAILMEGVTDAIFGGLTMGVFHVGGKIMLGLKEPLEEGAASLAKEGAMQAGDMTDSQILKLLGAEGQEELVEKGIRERGQDLITDKAQEVLKGEATLGEKGAGAFLKAFRHKTYLTKTQRKSFKKIWGMDFEDAMIRMGVIPKNGDEASKMANALIGGGDAKLHELLDQKIIPTEDVLKELNKIKNNFVDNKLIQPAAKDGIKQMDEIIDYTKGFGDEISGYQVNELKKQFQDAFPQGTTSISDKVMTQSGRKLRQMVEEMVPKELGGELAVRSANFKRSLGYNLQIAGENIDDDVFRFVFRFNDFIFGMVNPAWAISGKALELLGDTALTEEQIAKLIKNGLDMLSSRGASATSEVAKQEIKTRTRNLLRFAQTQGFSFTVSKTLLKEAGTSQKGEAEPESSKLEFSEGMEEINTPGFLLR